MVSKESDSENKEFNAEKLEYFGNRDGVGIRKCEFEGFLGLNTCVLENTHM